MNVTRRKYTSDPVKTYISLSSERLLRRATELDEFEVPLVTEKREDSNDDVELLSKHQDSVRLPESRVFKFLRGKDCYARTKVDSQFGAVAPVSL